MKKRRLLLVGILGSVLLPALTMGFHLLQAPRLLGDGQYGMFLGPTAQWGGFVFGVTLAALLSLRRANFKQARLVGLLGTVTGLYGWISLSMLGHFAETLFFCLPTVLAGLALSIFACVKPRC